MIRKIKLVKNAVDITIPKNYSRKELKKIENETLKEELLLKSTLSKIKALISLQK